MDSMATWLNTLLFGIYPYIAFAVFVIGCVIRFDREQYSWKASSSQLLDRSSLRLGSNLFHVGVLLIIVGHLVAFGPAPEGDALVTIGTRADDLRQAMIAADTPAFCIFGPPRSGKSTALNTIVMALRSAQPDTSVMRLGAWSHGGEPVAQAAVDHLIEMFRSGRSAPESCDIGRADRVIVAIDDLVDMGPSFDSSLAHLMSLGRDRVTVIASGDSARVNRFDEGQRRLIAYRNGLLLQPNLERDGALLDVMLPPSVSMPMPVGRGFLISRGADPSIVQVAHTPEPSVR